MEDNEDLFYYHQVVWLLIPSCELRPVQDGYQHNVTSAMTVELLKNLLESAEGKDLPQQGKLFFAHSETFLPLLVALGIAKDEVWMHEQSKYSFAQVIRAHALTTAFIICGEHAN